MFLDRMYLQLSPKETGHNNMAFTTQPDSIVFKIINLELHDEDGDYG